MRTWEVRYKLYRRSRRIDVIKVVAETNVEAVTAVILRIWRYPFKLVSVYEVKGAKTLQSQQAGELQEWINTKLRAQRVKQDAWKIIQFPIKAQPQMCWQERLFWKLDKPLHIVAYLTLGLGLISLIWWISQLR